MWYLVVGISLLSVGGTAVSLVFGRNSEAVIGLIIAALVTGAVIALFYRSKLIISIDSQRLYYKFAPFVSSEKTISQEDVKELRIREYKPILEYGGWGYRISIKNGKALNVSGNMGLQIVFKNGKRLLIGTQKPDLLRQAIRRLEENWKDNG